MRPLETLGLRNAHRRTPELGERPNARFPLVESPGSGCDKLAIQRRDPIVRHDSGLVEQGFAAVLAPIALR